MTEEINKKRMAFCEERLRNDFDKEHASFQDKEYAMYQAQELGLTDLVKEMQNDLKTDKTIKSLSNKWPLEGWMGFALFTIIICKYICIINLFT